MSQSEFENLLTSLDALASAQIEQLRRELDNRLSPPRSSIEPSLTEDEAHDQYVQQRLFDAGLLSEIKPSRREPSNTEEFVPIVIDGEPLSETIIRERR
jgi:hypothetical protein